jgi:hypothetical protein
MIMFMVLIGRGIEVLKEEDVAMDAANVLPAATSSEGVRPAVLAAKEDEGNRCSMGG